MFVILSFRKTSNGLIDVILHKGLKHTSYFFEKVLSDLVYTFVYVCFALNSLEVFIYLTSSSVIVAVIRILLYVAVSHIQPNISSNF